MPESLTISSQLPEHPGMNYALLRQEGIEEIARLAGTIWTDYNAHDPGITILEILCYALTDLSYRLAFDIEDLLAYPKQPDIAPPKQFFTAREALSSNPLTLEDYRKLLIDIDGVKNAWLEPIERSQPEIFYDPAHAKLSFLKGDGTEPVLLKGLYRILLEKESGYEDLQLIQSAKNRLQAHRNLCEDFAEIKVLQLEEIVVQAEIEIEDGVNQNVVMAQLYDALQNLVAPSIQFWMLKTLLDAGQSPAKIFTGPALSHGFIDSEQLQQFNRKSQLHISDFIHVILDIPGTKAVKSLTISSNQSPTPQEWALDLDTELTPDLKDLRNLVTDRNIVFYKGQIPANLDLDQIDQMLNKIQTIETPKSTKYKWQDLPIPQGEYRELSDYESIQNDFPLNYGIGEIGLPTSASLQRKAQAKQLQTYLMLFDQILANSMAQLDRAKDLFCFSNPQIQTYFSQNIQHFPAGASILNQNYPKDIDNLQETTASALERKNRFLDHLLAQYSEKFTDYSLLSSASDLSEKAIEDKVKFLLDYLCVSGRRSQAFNYTTLPIQTDINNNVSGLKRRISRLLGFTPQQQALASSQTEGFYLLEHILLRPRPNSTSNISEASTELANSADFLSFSHSITAFQASENPGYVTCISAEHGLSHGDKIQIFYTTSYNGTYSITNITTNGFDIQKSFVVSETGEWSKVSQSADPFSFQISFIFPDWPKRFQDLSFKQLIYDTLIAETPAHITIYCHWFNPEQLREFETTYALWLEQLADESGNSYNQDVVDRLITQLKLGSVEVPGFPALLGYMAIGEDFIITSN